MAGSIEQGVTSLDENAFTFPSFEWSDLPLLLRWLNNPAVSRWWDDPSGSVAELEGKYVPRLDSAEPVCGFVARYHGMAIGYLQWYRLGAEPDHPAIGLVPADAAAIDLFIGRDDYRRRGYGPVMIRAFLKQIAFTEPGVDSCASDPCIENIHAIAAYRKAGFRDVGLAPNPHEHCESLIMVLDKTDLPGE